MARAITQSFAWVAAFLLSALVFAGVIGFVMALPGNHGEASSEHSETTGSHASDDHGRPQESHEQANESHAAAPEGHAKEKGQEEEISAADFKKEAGHDEHGSSKDGEAPHH